MLFSPTAQRVPQHTSEDVNQRIHQETHHRLRFYTDHPNRIPERLAELDEEWDIERVLETNASLIALVGMGMGVTVSRKFYLLPTIVMGFLLQHALQGWCPPVPFFRRLGVRTQSEIEAERYALKALRGDFGADCTKHVMMDYS